MLFNDCKKRSVHMTKDFETSSLSREGNFLQFNIRIIHTYAFYLCIQALYQSTVGVQRVYFLQPLVSGSSLVKLETY